jgi:serine protease Do
MKMKPIATISFVLLLPFAVALSQPQPPPPPPPAAPAPPAPPAGPGRHHENGPKVPVIFLGVESSSVPSVLSEQMGLPKGFGLVVDYVVPDSPAAAAGVQQNDILKMLNDQILLEPNQLRKLLQSFQDGTTVTLTILRKGQEQKLTAKLTKKDVPKRNAFMNHGDFNFDFGDMNMGNVDIGDLKDRLQEMKENLKDQINEQVEQRKDMIRETVMKAHEAAERAREQARQIRDNQIRVQNNTANGLQTTKIDVNNARIVFSDDKGELRLETNDGKKILTAKDPKGLLLFSGPVETQQDVDKLPAEVRKRYEQLQQSELPSVVNSQSVTSSEDEDDEDGSGDGDDEDDSDTPTPEQVSISPQAFPRSLLPLHTILI